VERKGTGEKDADGVFGGGVSGKGLPTFSGISYAERRRRLSGRNGGDKGLEKKKVLIILSPTFLHHYPWKRRALPDGERENKKRHILHQILCESLLQRIRL